VEAIDGPVSLAQCFNGENPCLQFEKCNLKSPLQRLNDIVIQILSQVSLAQLVEEELKADYPGSKPTKKAGLDFLAVIN
jgi:DNA-binding IscR family transcriptional regulator